MMTAGVTISESAAVPIRTRSPWLFLATGAGATLVGLLPWLMTGARMPGQNLWAFQPASPPIVLLPFSQYAVGLIFALLIVGAAAAGIAGRALRARESPWGTTLLIAGVIVPQLIATIQTAITVTASLQDRVESTIYVAGLTGGSLFTIAVGALVTGLIARAPRAGALLGLTVGAIAMSSWVSSLIVPFGSASVGFPAALIVVQWVTPVLVGVAIAWTGINSIGRVISAVVAVVLAWVAPAAMTGIASALGARVYANHPAEMVDFGLGVFRSALFIPELALRPIIATVVTAAIGLGIRVLLARRASPASGTPLTRGGPSARQES